MLLNELKEPIAVQQKSELTIKYNTDTKVASIIMSPRSKPSFTIKLLNELKKAQESALSEDYKYIDRWSF